MTTQNPHDELLKVLGEREHIDTESIFPEMETPEETPSSADPEASQQQPPHGAGNTADHQAGDMFDEDDYELLDDEGGKPGWLGAAEDMGEEAEGWGEEDFQAFGDLLAGLVKTAKGMTNMWFSNRFQSEVRTQFNDKEQATLKLIMFLDDEGKLGTTHLSEMKEWAKEYETDLKTLVSMTVEYRDIKRRYQASEMEEYQEKGIRKYGTEVARRYLTKPNPLVMLAIYLVITIGADFARIGWATFQDRKTRKAEEDE